ncbi:MFS transporter [Sessilibacter sp. MAH2]
MSTSNPIPAANGTLIRWLTYLMFMMFGMTTDAVGEIIPVIIEEFNLSLTAASSFHYASMAAIGLSGLLLGFLADRIGRKATIIIGLAVFAIACWLFMVASSFYSFVALLVFCGVAIGIFKTGALAMVGDISSSTRAHSSNMNMVEGFFGVGAIVGPAVVAYLLQNGMSWKYLYLVAGVICSALIIAAALARYPQTIKTCSEPVSFKQTLPMMKNPYALGFSFAIFLYVATEVAIYVWMPTLFRGYDGEYGWMATYALTAFFIVRAAGRFLGAWVLRYFDWTHVMALFSGCIFACYLGAMVLGVDFAIFLLPLSGVFMSMMYPTLNSKGISCFPKSQHGTVAGVILFFTALSAAVSPLLMGAVSDWFGHVRYGFYFAAFMAGLLFLGMVLNLIRNPAAKQLNAQTLQQFSS